ncbi:MAG TPA: signal peptidase I [Acidimicrobiales bacterium]|nr:signal peptidase I [Acidimicrobiales bacterium]
MTHAPTPSGSGDGGGPAAPTAPSPGPLDAPDETPASDGRARTPRRSIRWLRTLLEWAAVLGVALLVAVVVRTYVIQTYFIPSISMEPTLQIGDHILVLKAAYDFTDPAIGDVIVFKAPPLEHNACQDPEVQDLVKRIIAVPGDEIRSAGNTIYVNGQPLAQPWQHTAAIGTPIHPQMVAPNRFFVMGDNRPESCDSRVWGTVPRSDIIGKAILIFWPLSRLSVI